ncbi:putative pyridoxal kinase [Orbilia oligospora]|uniref:pyridoxal kinase n=1 Tax=Orbilia oligospora TaxID=2813651 RepID=A0A6G1MHN3_ORBOL|nr:putative pyridoxal kinase [Orbilia oligospora]KAF3220287.1 putative pyridoxal kinase [Orbilia oligospora]KAF3221034.1 putative pyridoxal kinase [Orbilia oligospora]KAF3259021.1 putative pyridoxal kinase [Orbilia oligospora]
MTDSGPSNPVVTPSPNGPPTRVLSIASHVVSGYVGNTVATFVMQLLGLEVCSLNTVQFSNHTGYGKWTGTKIPSAEIDALYEGLKHNELADFDMLATGYVPGAEGVEAVGRIAKDLKETGGGENGIKFFWVLDPVMGDSGKLYVSETVIPIYKGLLPLADLITPNQYEVQWLTGIKLTSPADVSNALTIFHAEFKTPHIIISSVQSLVNKNEYVCFGSSMTTTGKPRAFSISVPMLQGPFVGTGDMFASLLVSRFRHAAADAGLLETPSWMSSDNVTATELPLARAAEMVLASMDKVLKKTGIERDRKVKSLDEDDHGNDAQLKRARYMRAAELRLVSCVDEIRSPVVKYRAKKFEDGVLQA